MLRSRMAILREPAFVQSAAVATASSRPLPARCQQGNRSGAIPNRHKERCPAGQVADVSCALGDTMEARMSKRMVGCAVAAAAWAALSFCLMPQVAFAASSAGCDGGGFSVLGLSGDQKTTVPAGTVGSKFLVKGKYVVFTVDSASFGVRDWTLTGAPNPLDITGEMPTIVFASKIPDHRGLALTSDVSVESSRESLVISRTARSCPLR